MLRGKNILLGVTGSIAAYKAAVLIRLLVKKGASIKVIMTPSATEFIGPLTLSTLSKGPVLIDFYEKNSGEWTSHVELGLWADAFIIAPATANTIAKFANGLCDNLLTAVYLSARCPVFIAPAMDLDMYRHPTTQGNIKMLKSHGNRFIDTEYGELASGLTGEGRMAKPEYLAEVLDSFFEEDLPLKNKKALVTAGPTYEAIDPVRFIGNHSSGKMGYAIAEELASRGAEVVLVSGPTNQTLKDSSIQLIHVTTAQEMYEKTANFFEDSDIAVLAAAVADYKPTQTSDQKIKKEKDNLTIKLTKTVDIAEALGKRKREEQLVVGFALETDNELDNARKKLEKKNFDLIILNSMKDPGAGFGYDTNKITIIDRSGATKSFDLKAKREVARDIVDEITVKING